MDSEEEESRAQAFHAQFGWISIISTIPKGIGEILDTRLCRPDSFIAKHRWSVIGDATHIDNQKYCDWMGKPYIRFQADEYSYRIQAAD